MTQRFYYGSVNFREQSGINKLIDEAGWKALKTSKPLKAFKYLRKDKHITEANIKQPPKFILDEA